MPVLSLRPDANHTVLELSSYQIEMSPHLDCDVSVLLKLAPLITLTDMPLMKPTPNQS